MVRIGICDDEKAVVYQLKEILENILQDINTEYEIFCYFSASDLLKNIANLNLIFLDRNAGNRWNFGRKRNSQSLC